MEVEFLLSRVIWSSPTSYSGGKSASCPIPPTAVGVLSLEPMQPGIAFSSGAEPHQIMENEGTAIQGQFSRVLQEDSFSRGPGMPISMEDVNASDPIVQLALRGVIRDWGEPK